MNSLFVNFPQLIENWVFAFVSGTELIFPFFIEFSFLDSGRIAAVLVELKVDLDFALSRQGCYWLLVLLERVKYWS
jgi:hypothetical protein